MLEARNLRNKETLDTISNTNPGYYVWWADREELDIILKSLDTDFDSVKSYIRKKDNLYAIYVGIAVKESVRARLNWHVNDKHTASKVKNGTLSTLRQSIASIVSHDQYDKDATNAFIDKLHIEYFYSENAIKSEEAKKEIHAIERRTMNENLYVLNIQENNHIAAKDIKRRLKALRKESK